MSNSVSRADTVTVCGYPLEKRIYDVDGSIGDYLYYMYTMSGTPVSVTSEVIRYNIDMTNGQSGSPVYVYNIVDDVYTVVGINCQDGENNSSNKACRIRQNMIVAFVSYGWCHLETE